MEQLRSQLAEILKDSVKHHMLSDVEVGAFLSGGVDSGYLASASGADQAFTVGFDEGDRYSEVNKAARCERTGFPYPRRNESGRTFQLTSLFMRTEGRGQVLAESTLMCS